MEYAKGRLAVLLFVAVVKFDVYSCQPATPNTADQTEVELRSMLNTVLEQNRRLTLQNKRLQQVWFGMQQMCKAMSMPTCDCDQDMTENQTTDSPPSTKSLPSVYVMSIKSSVTHTNQTSITIKYVATPEHTTEWTGRRRDVFILRTAGQRRQDTYNPLVYTSTINVSSIETILRLNFRLYNDYECAKIKLNVTAMDSEQEDVIEPDIDNIQIRNATIVAHHDTDVIVDVALYKNTRGIFNSFHVDVLLVGLNTSANPPEAFRWDTRSNAFFINCDQPIDDERYNISIIIMREYAQYGGILYVNILHNDTSDFVQEIYYGQVIQIYSPDGNSVVEKNMLGLLPLNSKTVIFPTHQNFMCASMGDPRPDVSIWKMTKDGKKVEVDTETLVLDSYTNSQVMLPHQPKQKDGNYICQATNGNQTINATTEVTFLEPALFDDAKTGVTKNTSHSIVISCKAKGKPKPQLELKLYGEYGPDLTKSAVYKIRRSNSNGFTSRVTLTIPSAEGPDVHSVYCLSIQGDNTQVYDSGRLIDLFPGQGKERNWDFFRRIMKEIGPVIFL